MPAWAECKPASALSNKDAVFTLKVRYQCYLRTFIAEQLAMRHEFGPTFDPPWPCQNQKRQTLPDG